MSDFFKFNEPIRTPDHPDKAYVVVAKHGDEINVIRFGKQYEEREWVGLVAQDTNRIFFKDEYKPLLEADSVALASFLIEVEDTLKEKNT